MTEPPDEWVAVGRIGKPHGLKGELTVELRTDDPEGRFAAGKALLRTTGKPLVVTRSRWHSGTMLVAVEDASDRNTAELLRDTIVYADTTTDEPLDDPDEFYDHQLVGLTVHLEDGTVVGTVIDVLHPPGADLLAVARDGLDEALIPFVASVVPTVDLAARTLTLVPPAGLLEGF